MGALAPNLPWIPEDDLLLKNAIEAGASLESLAKGAVHFSRKFTVRELRERWHSLLYDPVVSDEASTRMTEFEHYASTLPSKSNKFGNSKDNKLTPAKRKSESVRKCYYAMRKRICNEPFNSMDLSFLIAPNNSNLVGDGDEPLSGNGMLEDPITNPFGLEDSTLGIMHHGFPEILTDGGTATGDAAAAHTFHTEFPDPVEGDFHIETHNIHKEIPHIIVPSMSLPGTLDELDQPKDLPVHSLFEADDLGVKPGSTFDHSYQGNGFGEKQVCSLPGMPIWKAIEGMSEPGLPVDVNHRDKDLHTGDIFALPGDGDVVDACKSGYDAVQSDGNLNNQKPCDGLKSPAASTEGYLAVLSNSLMDFTNDDEILLMEDGKDMIGKFFKDGLSSLLLNSPADVNQDHVPEPETLIGLDTYVGKLCDNSESQSGDGCAVFQSEAYLTSSSNPQFPEVRDGVICCTLNTEDPEIPCNEDVIFHKQLPSSAVVPVAQTSSQDIGNPNSSDNKKTSERGPSIMQRESEHLSSQAIGSQVLPEMCHNQPTGDCGVKFELPNSDSQHVASTRAGFAGNCPGQIISGNVNVDAFIPPKTKEETAETTLAKHLGHSSNDCLKEKPSHGSDSLKSFPTKKEPSTIQNHKEVHLENFALSEPVANTSTLDQGEVPVESDDDIPYFSDVEAMILEMDLDPDDLDLYSSEEVSRYQHEDARRAIIREEQSFDAGMRREIAYHGAFAVLYGHRTKHYIKKPEVLLGRATEDVIVDIDLGREERANKISRRQAIIKMDKSGSFFLKNLGKYPVAVNDKEVASGQTLSLFSSCLIEIRGMPFILEVNQARVKRYLDSITKKNEMKHHKV